MAKAKNWLHRIAAKKFWKRKSFWILLVVLVLGCTAGGLALSAKAKKNKLEAAQESTVKSAEATIGTISSTIDGSGTLEAAETVDVTLPEGVTAEEVLVESGDAVSKGDTLAKLDKTSVVKALVDIKDQIDTVEDELDASGLTSLEKEELNLELDELNDLEDTLTALRKDPTLKATTDGVVSSVNLSDDASGTSSDGTTQSALQSNANLTNDSDTTVVKTSAKASEVTASYVMLSADTGSTSDTSGESSGSGTSSDTVIDKFDDFQVTAPATGKTPQKSIEATNTYTGKISWDCSGTSFQAGTVYSATIVLQAEDGYQFSSKYLPTIDCASYSWSISNDGDTLTIQAKFEKTEENTDSSQTNTDASTQTSDAQTAAGASASQGSSGSAAMSGISGSSGSASAGSSSSATTTSTDTDSGETTAFTIAKTEKAKVAINVDELDILSVEVGQSATITLDAIDGQEFTGSITKVSSSASSDSTSAKYEVDIEVPMDENMRVGMNASAVIQVEQAENVVTIPISALQQKGDQTFVYTTQGDDGTLGGETTVETGLSNSSEVEITSGLSEGDTVYYTKLDSSDSDSTDVFGGEMPGGGGEMPSGGGGEMPGGGGGGGAPGGGSGNN